MMYRGLRACQGGMSFAAPFHDGDGACASLHPGELEVAGAVTGDEVFG